jgi:hypothetical protein
LSVVFDENVFPFSTPNVSVDVSTLEQAITFPLDEPVTSVPMRKYDMCYLSTNQPVSGVFFPSQGISIAGENAPGWCVSG